MADNSPEAPSQAWTVMPPPPAPAPTGDDTQPEQQGAQDQSQTSQPELPPTFPRKRRGRPPGRPNMTVRETDYEDNALVQAWNAAKSERTLIVVPIRIREALTENVLVHESQRTIYRLPSREIIHYVQGWITARHIASQRPSYVNGLLIHSRGQDSPTSCNQCVERRAKNALGPFLTCRALQGVFHNSCSNCKWFDNTSACSLYTGPKPNRKRKAKEISASATDTQPNGTEENSNGVNAETAAPIENVEQQQKQQQEQQEQEQPAGGAVAQDDGVQTHPEFAAQTQGASDLSGLPYGPSDGASNEAVVSQDSHPDVSMGGTDDAQQHSGQQSASPEEEPSNKETPQPDELEREQATPASEPVESPGDEDGDEHHDGDGDNNSVDAQLAAQLLPELSKHE